MKTLTTLIPLFLSASLLCMQEWKELKQVDDCSAVQNLILQSDEVKEFGSKLDQFVNLKRITFCFHSDQKLPRGLEKLTSLTGLDVKRRILKRENKDNPLAMCMRLPLDIGQFTTLQLLDLSDIQLQTLPITMCKLKNLKELLLKGNQIEHWPSCLGRLSSLENLELDHNKLKELPPVELARLTNLEFLSLVGNELEVIPQSVSSLQKLNELHLDKNKLKQLTCGVIALTNLQVLSLENNNLSVLPSLKNLHSSLECLFLYGNPVCDNDVQTTLLNTALPDTTIYFCSIE